jgi:hypothetical protein
MVVNKTTKKIKPLFPLPSSLAKKKPGNSLNSTMRVQSTESKDKFSHSSLKRNEPLIAKLVKHSLRNNEIDEKIVNLTAKLDTEHLIAHSFKKFNKKPKKKKKAVLKITKKKDDKLALRNTLASPLMSMLVSGKKTPKDKLIHNKRYL